MSQGGSLAGVCRRSGDVNRLLPLARGEAHLTIPASEGGSVARAKSVMRWLMAVLLVLAGVNHFINPGFYVRLMPPYLPWHLALVYASGVAEVALGMALAVPKASTMAAWGIVAMFVVFLLVHAHMVANAERYPEVHAGLLWSRLALQAPLIAWAYWLTR